MKIEMENTEYFVESVLLSQHLDQIQMDIDRRLYSIHQAVKSFYVTTSRTLLGKTERKVQCVCTWECTAPLPFIA